MIGQPAWPRPGLPWGQWLRPLARPPLLPLLLIDITIMATVITFFLLLLLLLSVSVSMVLVLLLFVLRVLSPVSSQPLSSRSAREAVVSTSPADRNCPLLRHTFCTVDKGRHARRRHSTCTVFGVSIISLLFTSHVSLPLSTHLCAGLVTATVQRHLRYNVEVSTKLRVHGCVYVLPTHSNRERLQ